MNFNKNSKNPDCEFTAITTFNAIKHNFAVEMVNSFFINWPEEIMLLAFIENVDKFNGSNVEKKITLLDYHSLIPEYKVFCKKFISKRKHTDSFKFNAFTFAYKVYAIHKALSKCKTRYLIWLDSDIKTHKKIPLSFFKKLVKKQCYMSYLGRDNIKIKALRYSECGFLIFDTNHKYHQIFWKEMISMYNEGRLFNLPEWHDSYIFDFVRKKLEKRLKFNNFNICDLGLYNLDIENDEHVFVTSVLGRYMDHKKGERKERKWSPELIKRIKNERNS